jgi:hypothetical protein
VIYATDAPEVDTPERELMYTTPSDELDAVVGDLEAYSLEALTDPAECEFEEPGEDETDKRGLVLTAVFLLVETVLVIETVFVVFFARVEPSDPLGSINSVLLGVALFANFVAAIAVGWATEAGRRWEASFAAPTDEWMSIAD